MDWKTTNIINAGLWVVSLLLLTTVIAPNANVQVDKVSCQVEHVRIIPRFSTWWDCSLDDGNGLQTCDSLEEDTYTDYSPYLCYKWRFSKFSEDQDMFCPANNAFCDGDNFYGKQHPKCTFHSPLAFNVTVAYKNLESDQDKNLLGWKDVGVDSDKMQDYQKHYNVGDKMDCRLTKKVDGERNVMFYDEHVVSFENKWRWYQFLPYVLCQTGAIVMTTFLIKESVERRRRGYSRVLDEATQ